MFGSFLASWSGKPAAAPPPSADIADIADIHKGLANDLADNNCFLNVVVQALWHCSAFRRALYDQQQKHSGSCPVQQGGPGPPGGSASCIVCDLLHLFSEYEWGEHPVVRPTLLRETLARMLADNEFAMQAMGDASEAFLLICEQVHRSACPATDGGNDASCQPRCASHRAFSVELLEQVTCLRCSASSEPLVSSQFVLFAPVHELVSQMNGESGGHRLNAVLKACLRDAQRKSCPENCSSSSSSPLVTSVDSSVSGQWSPSQVGARRQSPVSFGRRLSSRSVLYSSGSMFRRRQVGEDRSRVFEDRSRALPNGAAPGRPRGAPEPVALTAESTSHLLSAPPVIVLGLVWQSDRVPAQEIGALLRLLDPRAPDSHLCPHLVFAPPSQPESAQASPSMMPRYYLNGIVGFYGRHYVAFWLDERLDSWLSFDDATVRSIGSWDAVVGQLVSGRIQPCLLFFVAAADAPRSSSLAAQECETHESQQQPQPPPTYPDFISFVEPSPSPSLPLNEQYIVNEQTLAAPSRSAPDLIDFSGPAFPAPADDEIVRRHFDSLRTLLPNPLYTFAVCPNCQQVLMLNCTGVSSTTAQCKHCGALGSFPTVN